ncbi:ATP-binding protein [Microvirga sp. W0021]|uniref:histidine kinase n=1 Tax=Hohaiivirga grylli TaxID=3133970 RepID=A0ABV0BMV3_9HYPH
MTAVLICAISAIICSALLLKRDGLKTPYASEAQSRSNTVAQIQKTIPEAPAVLNENQADKQEDIILSAREAYRKRQMQYEQMIEVINNLTGAITHDMNLRLNTIETSLSEVINQLNDQPPLKRKLKTAQSALYKAENLMAKLASFSSQREWQSHHVDINEQLTVIADLIRRSLLSEAIKLDIQTGQDLWPVELDPDQLQMSLINIAINSREAMPRGGTITMIAENALLRDEALKLYGDFVTITVKDTGAGISSETLEKVFRPFFTTMELRKGVGIGLNQVKTFAMRVNGDVTIESIPGAGTSVTLYLPRASHEAESQELVHSDITNDSSILIVTEESSSEILELQKKIEHIGYSVIFAHTPEEALDIINQNHPSVIMTDPTMRGTLDGITLGRQLRHRNPEAKIIMLTESIMTDIDFPVLHLPVQTEQLQTLLNPMQ